MIFNMAGGGGPTLPQYAAISVIYNVGLVCTCSDGITTLTAPDTSGVALFVVPYAATWVISDGSRTENVSITAAGQVVSVNIGETILFQYGDETLSTFRTHWRRVNSQASTSISTYGDTYYTFASTGTNLWGWQYNTAVNLTDFTKLRVYGYRSGTALIGFNTSSSASAANVANSGQLNPGTTDGVYESDITSLTGNYYLGIRCTGATFYAKKVVLV